LLSFIASSCRSFAGRRPEVNADPGYRWLDHRPYEAGEVDVPALRPRRLEDRAEQDVLAALQRVGPDAEQRQQAGGGGGNALAQQVGVIGQPGARRIEGFQDRDRDARGAAGGVDDELRCLAQAPDTLPVLAPIRQALLPQRGLLVRVLLRGKGLAARVVLVDPGQEVRRLQIRKRQQ
jgi:hypothetical protein